MQYAWELTAPVQRVEGDGGREADSLADVQVPDFLNACIAGEPAMDIVSDEHWFRNEFTPTVAGRGAHYSPQQHTPTPSNSPWRHLDLQYPPVLLCRHVFCMIKKTPRKQLEQFQSIGMVGPHECTLTYRRTDSQENGAVPCSIHSCGDCGCCEEPGGAHA